MTYAEVVVSSSQATSQSLPISVLDLIPSRAGEPASSAIAQSVELARHVEQLGYKRYWVAEHHSIQGLVCSATPIGSDASRQFYRERCQPSEVLQTPYLLIAAQVIAAETDAAARRLFTTPQQRFLRLIRGEPAGYKPLPLARGPSIVARDGFEPSATAL